MAALNEISRKVIPITHGPVNSLCWFGNEIVDVVSGMVRYSQDGPGIASVRPYDSTYNRAITLPDNRYTVIYQVLGGQGLILDHQGRILREIRRGGDSKIGSGRSDRYEYPIALFYLPDGTPVIAHCPEEYCRIEIEEVATGNCLTVRETESNGDVFPSRLQVSADSAFLLSAGWGWSPINYAVLYDIGKVLNKPELLDAEDTYPGDLDETDSAAFNGTSQVICAGTSWNRELSQNRHLLAAYDVITNELISRAFLDDPAGIMMPVGDYAVGFYDHPKLIELATGKVSLRWRDIKSGTQTSSFIDADKESLSYIALDPLNKRFAVAGPESITVVQLG